MAKKLVEKFEESIDEEPKTDEVEALFDDLESSDLEFFTNSFIFCFFIIKFKNVL